LGILFLAIISLIREMRMNAKKTMTLNLTEKEMAALERLCRKKDLNKTALLRQALRLYELIDARLEAGEAIFSENRRTSKKAELMVL